MERIQESRYSIATCTRVNDKRSNAFLKSLEVFKDLEGPSFVKYLGIIKKEQLEMDLRTIKASWAIEFDELTDFPPDINKETTLRVYRN
jgi:hypothetical protein